MSFLKDYLQYVEYNEAHENYHTWAALTALATLAARRVWVRRAYQRIYPNLYTILVGPQGNRKTAAKEIAQDLLRDCGDINFSSEATSREAIIKQMEECEQTFMYQNVVHSMKPLLICVTEFKEFLSIDPARIINFLTTVYDQNFFDYSTIKRGRQVLVNPCLNLLACETPDWLTERLKDKVVSGGFSRRVVYVHETEHKRIILKTLPQACIDARKRCVDHGLRIKEAVGEFRWGEGAEEFYDQWYLKLKIPQDRPAMVGYYDSKHTLLLKVGMMVSLSLSNNLHLTKEHLEVALALLEIVEGSMHKVFVGGGRNELAVVGEKAMDFLRKAGGPIPETELSTMLFHDCKTRQDQDYVKGLLRESRRMVSYSDGRRIMVCATVCLPKDVEEKLRAALSLQSSKPAAETSSDTVSASGQQSEPSSTQLEKLRQLQEYQQNAQAASDEDKASPH